MTGIDGVMRSIERWDSFLISCHVDPDPDCIGSMLALDWLFEKLGKRSQPLSHDPILPQWRFLPRILRIESPSQSRAAQTGDWDALIAVDCELQRTGDAAALAGRVREVVNIDHHVTNPGSGHVNWVRTDAAAAGEIVFDLIQAVGPPLDADVSTLLYAAIMADTGSFRFGNTSARVFEIASHLVRLGARPDIISREIYDTRSWSYVKLLGRVLESLRRSPDGKVAWIRLTRRMIREEGAREDESEGFIQYPRMIDGVEVAIIFRELDDGRIRVGFRSRERVDVSALAQEFGGGGHARASGCTLAGDLADVERRVVERAAEVASDIP